MGRRLQFTATGQNVTWELEDSLIAGSIDANGLYFAPPSPGVFHLVARSSFGARRVQITVRELRLARLAGEYGGRSEFPIDGVGDAARVSNPRSAVMSSGALWFFDGFETLTSPYAGALRRFDPVTRETKSIFVNETLDGPVRDGPLGVGTFGFIACITSGGPHSLLIRDNGAIRELDTDTLELTTIRRYGMNDPSLMQQADELLQVGNTIYGVVTFRHVIVKWVRGEPTDEVLAGGIDLAGNANGPGASARFHWPMSLAFDGVYLFVIDDNGRAIRRITTSGMVTTPQEYVDVMSPGFASLSGIPPEFIQLSNSAPQQLLVTTVDGYVGINASIGIGRLYANSIVMEGPRTALATAGDSIRRFDVRAGIPEVVAGRAGVERGRDDGQGASARMVFSMGQFNVRGDTAWFCEELTGRIRTVNRAGEVKTPFQTTPQNGCTGPIVVSDEHVYAVGVRLPQGQYVLRRAPRFGGAWEEQDAPFDTPRLLGVLNDGRVVVASNDTVGFIDPATFRKLPTTVNAPGAFAIDPAGAIFARSQDGSVDRFELATSTWADFAPTIDFTLASSLTFANGKLYAIGTTSFDTEVPVIFELDPAVNAWAPLVGKLRTGAVLPGPLPRALLHEPGWIGAFDNGDLLVSDRAEDVFLVIE